MPEIPVVNVEKCPCSTTWKTYGFDFGMFYQGCSWSEDVAKELARRINLAGKSEDFYMEFATRLFDVEKPTDEQRSRAKLLLFAIRYKNMPTMREIVSELPIPAKAEVPPHFATAVLSPCKINGNGEHSWKVGRHGRPDLYCTACAAKMQADETMLPQSWEVLTGVKVIDPDGWRNAKQPFDKPITFSEWERLLMHSTCDYKNVKPFFMS